MKAQVHETPEQKKRKKIFIDVQKFSSGGTNLYIRLASSELGHKKIPKAIISTVAVLVFVVVSVCTLLLWKRLTYTAKKTADVTELQIGVKGSLK